MASIIIPRSTIWLLIVLLIFGILAGFGYVYLPQAKITVTPAIFVKPTQQEMTLSSIVTEPDFVRFILPARVVEANVTENQLIQREGGVTADDFARGLVTFYNKQDEEQPLLPKTNLRHETSGVFFLTDQPVRIPPQGTITVAVTAKESGAVGNVPAGRFIVDKLPASLQTVVYAESTTPFTGGQIFDTPLTEEELNTARERVDQQARTRLTGELTLAAGGANVRSDLTVIETKENVVTAEVGSKTTSFTASVSLRGRAFVGDDNDLLGLSVLALRSFSNENEDFVSYNPDSFAIEIVKVDFERGEARVKTSVTGNYARKTEAGVFDVSNLAGRSAAEIQEYYRQFASVQDVVIKFWPFWVQSIPSRPSATEIIVKNNSRGSQ